MVQQQEEILDFWFDYANHPDIIYNRVMWWEKGPDQDAQIREQFLDIHQAIAEGGCTDWLQTPRGVLAHIIVLDQFSRNLFRNAPEMFAYDDRALQIAKDALERGDDRALTLTERLFLYLPFEHSENPSDQEKSLQLFEQLVEDTPEAKRDIAKNFLGFAKQHYDIITQFGRFPHRNKVLSRDTRPEEEAFLSQCQPE